MCKLWFVFIENVCYIDCIHLNIYFVNNGIAKNRLTTISEGDISPIAKNDTDENKAKNRRVEFKGELK